MTGDQSQTPQPPPRRAGIKDVAARAGVSLKTVTNVVHERPYVSAETRARVKAAIVELNYQPTLAGRQLQSGRSNMVTLAVPRIDDPYLGALAHAMIAAATARGYTLLIDETGGRTERERLAASGYPGHGIDGVIFSAAALDSEQITQMSQATPIVLLGDPVSNSNAAYVSIDNVASAREVVDHLLAGGRRRIAFLGHQTSKLTGVAGLRYRGYREQARAAGLQLSDDWAIGVSRFTREEGKTRAGELLAHLRSADSLICASDLLAIGAMRAFQEAQVRVPDDIAVVGWDNTVDGAYHTPSLTSVAPALPRLAEVALDALISRINGNLATGETYVVPHQLVPRESSAAPAG